MTPKEALRILDTSASFYESDYTVSAIGYYEAKKEREEATATIEKMFKLLELYQKKEDCIVCVPLSKDSQILHCVVRYSDDEKYMKIYDLIKALEGELK